eukprot:CAMPEP_0195525524 /NCGR_PEP_ID=MMETSP0794_2-20130614/26000_1 /TAXON_ID=515487 /ORGANISM="Stephanopyxis turris, Strain CCMP 815" /LENGTH=365 /DNA_ID=CAMNT_0040656003 /DNA_START=22 /DNA_END=1119 /DNA_ORIENTATION=+
MVSIDIPVELVPYWEWACINLPRPFLIILVALLFWNLNTLLYKLELTYRGIAYLLFCNDKKWKKPADPMTYCKPILEDETKKDCVEKKTIIFVRHGESNWNDTFNKGSHRGALVFVIGFIPNLIYAVLYEFYLLLAGKMDSWFYDSPLSHLGLSQIEALNKFLKTNKGATEEEKKLISILRGEPEAPSSCLLSSSLRRALSTVAAAFRDRLDRRPDDTILVVPSLQEISRNPDTLAITPAHQQVTASWIDKESKVCDFQHIFTNRTDMSLHSGNKPMDTNGLKRMMEFCTFAFTRKEEALIVGGHSIYFRSFFRTFLPANSKYIGKTKKVVNAGCVGFTLLKVITPQGVKFMIDEKSATVIYGGF